MHEYIIPLNEKEVLIKESEGNIIKVQKYTEIKEILELENESETLQSKIENKQKKLKKYRKITGRKFFPIMLPIFTLVAIVAGPLRNVDINLTLNATLPYSFNSLLLIPIGVLGDIINYVQYKKLQKKEINILRQIKQLRKKQAGILNTVKEKSKTETVEQIEPINLVKNKSRKEMIKELKQQRKLLIHKPQEEAKKLIKKYNNT